MIVSHKHQFIYLKTAKTAGTSIEAGLLPCLGPNDIVTGFKARNHLRGLGRIGINVPSTIAGFLPQISGFYPHMRGWQVRAIIGEEIWNSYFKFTSERNPWDRQVSQFFRHHKIRKGWKRVKFETYLLSPWYTTFHTVRIQNWEAYTINGEIAVDQVLRFENLASDFDEVCKSLGLGKVSLPHENRGPKREHRHYRDYYNDRTRAAVEDWYRREIEEFGYTF